MTTAFFIKKSKNGYLSTGRFFVGTGPIARILSKSANDINHHEKRAAGAEPECGP